MLTTKQRAQLRGLANTLTPILQIGKGNIGASLAEQLDLALEARELVKITILQSADIAPRDALDQLVNATGAEAVQCIGRKIVLYRESVDNKQIQLVK